MAPQQELSKTGQSTKNSVQSADQDYEKLTGKDAVIPSAPVYAARLNGLLKSLASAEGAVAQSIKSRQALINGLEKLLDTHRLALTVDQANRTLLEGRRSEIDAKKKEVEDSIMRGLPTSNPTTPIGPDGSPSSMHAPGSPGPIAPEVEALTPPRPKYEELTPPQAPIPDHAVPAVQPFTLDAAEVEPIIPLVEHDSASEPQAFDASSLANLMGLVQQHSSPAVPLPKKRKLDGGDDFPDLGGDAMDDLDADVVASLNEQ